MTMAHLDFGLRNTMPRAAESIYENGKFLYYRANETTMRLTNLAMLAACL
jgi:hypothetical protein